MAKTKLFLILLAVAFPTTIFASTPTECGAVEMPYQVDGTHTFQFLGYSVDGVGDVNGDGKADFIVGAPGGWIGAWPGRAYVYSGTDGSLLFQLTGSSDNMGYSVAGAGDVNGDGKPDFICGAPYGRTAYVFSGADGSLLHRVTGPDWLGTSVAGGKDVNGDGRADFIVGAPGGNPPGPEPGYVLVYSGADGALLYRIDGSNSGDQMGHSVALLGDLNSDGKSEFGIGARWTDLNGFTQVGSVYVYSGADGSLMYRKDGSAEFDIFGWSLANAGDVNVDGKPDFAVGALQADPDGLSGAGSVFVYSGADGSLLRRLDGFASGEHLGFSVSGAGDINGDGFADIITGTPDATSLRYTGAAYVFSGRDGSLLYQMTGSEVAENVGFSVAGLGDADGDGKGDFVVGTPAPPHSPTLYNAGWVRVFKSGSLFGDINVDGIFTA